MKQIRKSPRAKWIEYNEGVYFVTICTKYRIHYFGEIKDEQMHLSPIGQYVDNELSHVADRYEYVSIPQYVVMPNHIHAIVVIDTPKDARRLSQIDERVGHATSAVPRPLLSVYIAMFKASVTRYARSINAQFAWQSRYHDHLIRGTHDGNLISQYIDNNVLKWDLDCFNNEK